MNGRSTAHFFGLSSLGPRDGPKGQLSFNFNYKVSFKDFKPNFVCLLTNERYKTYQARFSFGRYGHAPGGWAKWANIIYLNYKDNFKDFLTKLCVSSHK